MKGKYIIGFVIIGIAMAIIISMAGDASSYVTFEEAKQLSDKGFDKSIHVVGELPKTPTGTVTSIIESPDKLSFRFDLIDEVGKKQTVLHNNPVPTDFLKSEKVVIIGAYEGDKFIANKILLKCPSKYQEDPDFAKS